MVRPAARTAPAQPLPAVRAVPEDGGVDPNTQVDELAWGAINAGKSGGEQVLGVALGTFDPSSSEALLKQQKMPMTDYHGYHLYAFGSGSGAGDILFTLVDANTAAFGVPPRWKR